MSHNNMSSFFSGTDMGELHSNSPNHVYYLSLIVNNKGSFVAKLAYVGKQLVNRKISMQNKIGKWVWGKPSKPVEEEVLFIHDCTVAIEMVNSTKFVQRVKKVIERADKRAIPATPKYTSAGYHGLGNGKDPAYKGWDKWSGRDGYDYPPALHKYTAPSVPSLPESSPKRTQLAKHLIACELSPALLMLSLTAHVNKAEEVYKDMVDEGIVESYREFFTTTSPTFLGEAYQEVYGEDVIEANDKFGMELEEAVNLIPGRIGEALRDVIDEILMEYELAREEESEALNAGSGFNIVN